MKIDFVLPDKLTLLVTGSGKRTDEISTELILRTDDATLHFNKDSEFGKLANALIDGYNERQKLKDCIEAIEARIHGEWDNKCLMAIGALSVNTDEDILEIINHYQ